MDKCVVAYTKRHREIERQRHTESKLNEQKNDFLFVESSSKTSAHENCLYWLLQNMNKTNFMTVVYAIDGRNNLTPDIVAWQLI